MESTSTSRRKALQNIGLLGGLTLLPGVTSAANSSSPSKHNFTFCLNTSTIRGQRLSLVEEIELVAKAGYDGIEIWINSMFRFVEEGGKLSELKKRIDDLGIQVEDAIGFAPWIVDNNDQRMQGLEQAKKEMGMLAELGCRRIAAPPAGATNVAGLDLYKAAERFRALVDLGEKMGVMPQLEVWGFSKNLSRLSEVLFVAAETGHPGTRILPDVYHLYRGGSDFDGLKLINPATIEIFHVNDYSNKIGPAEIQDKDRVHAGEGDAPLGDILRNLHDPENPTVLSLELFNRDYWKMDALEVAKTGLRKMKEAAEKALSQ